MALFKRGRLGGRVGRVVGLVVGSGLLVDSGGSIGDNGGGRRVGSYLLDSGLAASH